MPFLCLVIVLGFMMASVNSRPNDPSAMGGLIAQIILLFSAVALTVGAALHGLTHAIRRQPISESGILLGKDEEPRLAALIMQVCNSLGVNPPRCLVLHTEPVMAVTERRCALINGESHGRTLIIGLPIIVGLTVNELRAVVAHELAHFSRRDTLYSALVMPAYSGLQKTAELLDKRIYHDSGVLIFYLLIFKLSMLPASVLLRWYFRVFHRAEIRISRGMEYRADALATVACGSGSFASGLKKAVVLLKAFETYKSELRLRGVAEVNGATIYRSFRERLPQLLKTADQTIAQELSREDCMTHSHPPLKQRLDRLPSARERYCDDNPSLELLNKLSLYERDLDLVAVLLLESPKIYPEGLAATPGQKESEHFDNRSRRLVAFGVDLLLMAGSTVLLYRCFNPRAFERDVTPPLTFGAAVGVFCLVLYSLMESSSFRATPGKLCFGICVADPKHTRLSWWKAFLRNLLKYIACPLFSVTGAGIVVFPAAVIWGHGADPIITAILPVLFPIVFAGLGAVPMLWGNKQQAMWDVVTGAVVLRKGIPDDELAARAMLDAIARYSTLGRRFLCGLIDLGIIYGPIFMIALLVHSEPDLSRIFDRLDRPKEFWLGAYAFFCYIWIYLAGMDSAPCQGTLGKLACGIVVTDRSGRPISFARASVRCLLNLLMIPGLGLGFLAAFVTKRRQTVPDLMTQCVVLRTPLPPAIPIAEKAKPVRQLRWLWIPLVFAGLFLFARAVSRPDVAVTLNNRGIRDSGQGRMEEARKEYAEALQIFRELAQKDPETYRLDVATMLNNLGILDSDEGRMEQAHKELAEALQIYGALAKQDSKRFSVEVTRVEKLLAELRR